MGSTEDWNGNATVTFYGVDFAGGITPSNNVYVVVIPDENEISTLTTSVSPINFSEDGSLNMNLLCNPEDVGQICLNYRYDSNYSNYNSNLTVNVNSATGAIALSTKQDWNGITYVKFLADDNGIPVQTGSLVAKINVTPVNDNPLMNIPDQNVNEDSAPFTLNLATYTTDVDNLVPGEMTWKLMSQSNANLINCSITGSSLTCPAPSANQAGYSNLIIEVKDSAGGVGNQILKINVNSVNDAPVINSSLPLAYTTQEDTPLSISLKPYESDADSYDVDSNLTWSVSGVDINLFTTTINNATDSLIVSPLPNKFGANSNFVLRLTDSKGATDSRTLTLNVNPANDLPVLDLIPALTAIIGKSFTYQVNATDIDSNGLIFSDDSPLFNIQTAGNSGIISFTPVLSDYGNHLVNISVSDGQGGMDFQSVNLFIDFDKAPAITSYSPTGTLLIKTGSPQSFSVVAQDIDSPILTYQWSVDNSSVGTNTNSYTYTPATAGTYEIKVAVSDGTNSAGKSWILTASSYPIATEFSGDETTDLSQVNLSNVQNLILENQYGKIQFLSPVDLTNAWDLNSNVEISNKIVAINSQLYSSLNKPAKITLYGLSYNSIPKIFYSNQFTVNAKDIDETCDFCNLINYTNFPTTNGTLVFEVQHFSSFAVEESGIKYNISEFEDLETCVAGEQGNLIVKIEKPDDKDGFGPGEEMKIEVNVKNNADEEKKIVVEAYLYNIDENEEIEDTESDYQEIKKGRSEDFELAMKVPDDFEEDDDYILFVKAYEKGDEETECSYNVIDIGLEREKHKLIISEAATESSENYRGGLIDLTVKINNIGSEEEEGVYINVKQESLGIDEKSDFFDIEEYGEDDSHQERFSLKVPTSAQPGKYDFLVEVIFDNQKESRLVPIEVLDEIAYTPVEKLEPVDLTKPGEVISVDKTPLTINVVKEKANEPKNPVLTLLAALIIGIIIELLALVVIRRYR